ncbi:MAG: hypothetical protein OXP71_12495 [Candidatus Poribacteria bacterium]|nr:hypothetical protein [Candidatus Poribacteria bacterium]
MPYRICPTAASDASKAFQIELDSRAIAAMDEIASCEAQGAARETILRKHLGTDYDDGYRGTAWERYGISEGLTPAKLAEMLDEYGETFDPCAERETFDYSMMINVESELKSQLEFVSERILNAIAAAYKQQIVGQSNR